MAAWQAQAHLATALEAASFAPEPPQGQPIPVGQGLYLNPSPLMGASCSGARCSVPGLASTGSVRSKWGNACRLLGGCAPRYNLRIRARFSS